MLKKIVFISLLVSASIAAQTTDQENPVKFRSGIDFYFINGYSIAYKFNSSGSFGYRLKADMNFSTGGHDNNDAAEELSETSLSQRNYNDNTINYFINFSPQIYFNLFSSKTISIYYGFGPYISYSYQRNEDKSETIFTNKEGLNIYNISLINNTNKKSDFGLGAQIFLSIEGKVTDNVLLFAESSLQGVITWGKLNQIKDHSSYGILSIENKEYYNHNWRLTLNSIRLGAIIYF